MAKKNMTLEEKLEEAIVKDGPYEVPKNWMWSKLGIVAEWGSGGTPKSTNKAYYDGEIPWLIIADLNDGEVFDSNKKITESGLQNSSAKIIPIDSVLIAMYGSIGKLGINKISCACNQAIAFTKNISNVTYNKFLYYYLLFARDKLIALGKGGTQQNISLTVLKEVNISIPPLKEQQRIVDRIESLFEKLDKAKELIEEAREGVEKRKSAVLEKAFRGELTTEWRKNNTVKIFGADYLSYISKKREEIFSCLVKDSKRLGMKKPTKIHNADGEYEAMENCETWIRTKLCNVIYDFRYGTSSKSEYSFEGKPVIRIPNLSNGYITHDDMKYLKEDEVELNNKVNTGDILIVRSNGSPLLVGKTSIITELESDFAFASYLIRIRPIGIDSKFLYYMLNSISVKEQFYSKSKSTSGINNINTVELGNSIIVLPPLEEQKEIVKILDKLLEEESKIEELTQLEEQIQLIKKSILGKSFRGELGTNCEDDESALELLKGILSK